MNTMLRFKPADLDDAGQRLLSPQQEDALDQARRTASESLRRNRALVVEAMLANEELLGIIAAAYLAGDMNRARPSLDGAVEAEIRSEFRRNDDDFDCVARAWRQQEREMPRVVLPEVGHG